MFGLNLRPNVDILHQYEGKKFLEDTKFWLLNTMTLNQENISV